MEKIKSLTVGALKEALEGIPDDAAVLIDHPDAIDLLKVEKVSAERVKLIRKGLRSLVIWCGPDDGEGVVVIRTE